MIIGIDASRANRIRKTGTEWYAYSLIRQFAHIDKENDYILYSDKPLTDGLLDLTNEDYNINVDKRLDAQVFKKGYQELKSPHNNFRGKILKWPFKIFWTQGRLSLEMLFKRPDILFIPSHALPIIHPKKSIVTIHDIGFDKTRNIYQKEDIGPANKNVRRLLDTIAQVFTLGKYHANTLDYLHWTTEFAIKHAKKIITVSNFSKQEIIEEYKADKNRISVIHNGYNETLYAKCNEQATVDKVLKKYGIRAPYFLYTGRIEKKKNISALIEAFAIMRDYKPENKKIKLVLVGKASYGFDEVNYMIREFALEQDVIIPGWIDEEDMPGIYSGALAFIFPSVYEGFGIPLLQAMACETPIIASNVSSIPEVVGNAALLFNPEYVKSIAEAMDEVVKNNDLREKIVTCGKERVKNFGWKKCAEETLSELINS